MGRQGRDTEKRLLDLANLAYAAQAGMFNDPRFRKAVKRIREEQEAEDMKTCLNCGSPVAEAQLLNAFGETAEEGGNPDYCIFCLTCEAYFIAGKDYQTRTANVDGVDNP